MLCKDSYLFFKLLSRPSNWNSIPFTRNETGHSQLFCNAYHFLRFLLYVVRWYIDTPLLLV